MKRKTRIDHRRRTQQSRLAEGARAYQRWRDQLLSDPENRRLYEEEAAKSELWLPLVEARMAAGLTQEELAKRLGISRSQVSRIEKRGYDACNLSTLRRYVKALGDGFQLDVKVRRSRKPARTTLSR